MKFVRQITPKTNFKIVFQKTILRNLFTLFDHYSYCQEGIAGLGSFDANSCHCTKVNQ